MIAVPKGFKAHKNQYIHY